MKKITLLFVCILTLFIIGCTDNNKTNDTSKDDLPKEASYIGIIYFSATQNTKRVAEYIGEYYNVEIYEITPKVPYTSSDLNYNNSSSRVSTEHNDKTIRPEIENDIDITNFDYIFLGYPIWWGEAPNILYTFVESKDFSDKTIIPFATSASSSLGSSASNLAKNTNGNWLNGKRFSSSVSMNTVNEWLDSLNIMKKEQKTIKTTINEKIVNIKWEDNLSVLDLKEKLNENSITIITHQYGNFEQVGSLGVTLKSSDERITTSCGDIVLYNNNNICFYYASNTWEFTRLGKIINMTNDEIISMLSGDSVKIVLSLE